MAGVDALRPETEDKRSVNDLIKTEDMTPEQLGGEIRLLTRQARQMVLEYGIQIGYRLQLAKDKVGEDFAGWVERETEISKSSAYRFIKLYNEYGSAQGSLLGVRRYSITPNGIVWQEDGDTGERLYRRGYRPREDTDSEATLRKWRHLEAMSWCDWDAPEE